MLRKFKVRSLNFKKSFFSGELNKFCESFLGATNATYIENLYSKWLEDPK